MEKKVETTIWGFRVYLNLRSVPPMRLLVVSVLRLGRRRVTRAARTLQPKAWTIDRNIRSLKPCNGLQDAECRLEGLYPMGKLPDAEIHLRQEISWVSNTAKKGRGASLHPSAKDGATARCCTWCKARLSPRLQLW